MRQTRAFKEAVAQTLAELAHRGVTLAPSMVQHTIEKHVNLLAERLGIQVRSAWRYFDADAIADRRSGLLLGCRTDTHVRHPPRPGASSAP